MFDELFDRTDHIFEKPIAAELETIVQAAFRMPNGKIWTGPAHAVIINKMEDAGVSIDKDEDGFPFMDSVEDGFVTSTGRFVDRSEAAAIAQKAKQVKHPRGILTHDQLESIEQLKPITRN